MNFDDENNQNVGQDLSNNSFIIPPEDAMSNQTPYQAPIYRETPVEPIGNDSIPVIEEQPPVFENPQPIVDEQPTQFINPEPFVEQPKTFIEQEPVVEEKPSLIDPDIMQRIMPQETEVETSTKSFMPEFDVSIADKKQAIASLNNDGRTMPPINLMSNTSTDLYQSGPRVYAVEKPKVNIPVVVILSVIVLIVAGYFVYTFLDTATKEMICESNVGNITIKYNKTTVIGYKSNKITYNLYDQRTYADEVGITQYLDEFETWFKENTQGTCKR